MSQANNDNVETTLLTIKELKEPLSPAEREEMDNPDYLPQLNLFIEGVNNIPNLKEELRHAFTQLLR